MVKLKKDNQVPPDAKLMSTQNVDAKQFQTSTGTQNEDKEVHGPHLLRAGQELQFTSQYKVESKEQIGASNIIQSEVSTKQIVLAAGVARNGRKKTVIKLPSDGRRGGRSQKPAISSNPYFNMEEGKFQIL